MKKVRQSTSQTKAQHKKKTANPKSGMDAKLTKKREMRRWDRFVAKPGDFELFTDPADEYEAVRLGLPNKVLSQKAKSKTRKTMQAGKPRATRIK